MHRHAGRFADRHQARHDRVGIAVLQREHFAHIVRGNAAHVVMHGRQHRDRLLGDVDAGEDARGFRDARQPLVNDLRIEMRKMQMDVVLFGPTPRPSRISIVMARLRRHRARRDLSHAAHSAP